MRRPCHVLVLPLLCLGLAVPVAACGDDDSDNAEETGTTPAAAAADLGAIKAFLTDHTAQLVGDTAAIREDAEAYHRLAEGAGSDYGRLLEENRAEVASFVKRAQEGFRAANPSYEEMEGVVTGVPELADFEPPYWAGVWLGIFPTVETIAAQIGAVVFVVGSYLLAERMRTRGRRRAARVASAPAAAPPASAPPASAPSSASEPQARASRQRVSSR